MIFEHEGDTVSCNRRADDEIDVVEYQLAFDPDAEFAAASLEFPYIKPAGGRQAKVDAGVLAQVVRSLGLPTPSEVERSCDCGHA